MFGWGSFLGVVATTLIHYLYLQLSQRMGVVVVGPSGCGKTVLWKTLQTAMCKIGREVKVYTMNPKALPRHKLLGSIDIDTREWSDGILTYAARQVTKFNWVNSNKSKLRK